MTRPHSDDHYGYRTLYVNGIPVKAVRPIERSSQKELEYIRQTLARRLTEEFLAPRGTG